MNSDSMKEHFKLLGFKVRDVVTGFEGIATTISFDLYGCVQAIVSPGLNDKGEPGDGRWFDVKRLVATGGKPVMELPTFEVVPGGSEKPSFPQQPIR